MHQHVAELAHGDRGDHTVHGPRTQILCADDREMEKHPIIFKHIGRDESCAEQTGSRRSASGVPLTQRAESPPSGRRARRGVLPIDADQIL